MKQFAIFVLLATAAYQNWAQTADQTGQLRTNLYIVAGDKSPVLMDGTLTQYHANYSNDVDGKDARKMSNFSENWGMQRANGVFVIERRADFVTDSIFFAMWNMRNTTYEIEFVPQNMESPGRIATLEDTWTNTTTPIRLAEVTKVRFMVNDEAGSRARDRFRLIFSSLRMHGPLPVTFVSVIARPGAPTNMVEWKTANESNLFEFVIEKSTDGKFFRRSGSVAPKGKPENVYTWNDPMPSPNSFYRIAARDKDGKIGYSEIIRAQNQVAEPSISIFPNPVNTPYIQLKINELRGTTYEVRLIHATGRVVASQQLKVPSGESLQRVTMPAGTLPGIYRLQMVSPFQSKTLNVVIRK